LSERHATGYPPFSFLAVLRAEAMRPGVALDFLTAAYETASSLNAESVVTLFSPIPSPMERRAGRYRAQLLIQAGERKGLQAFLRAWREKLLTLAQGRRVRWSLDVDPEDLY
jgi:primosomal protein N' (replication factor Y) (superfamily II helicase)